MNTFYSKRTHSIVREHMHMLCVTNYTNPLTQSWLNIWKSDGRKGLLSAMYAYNLAHVTNYTWKSDGRKVLLSAMFACPLAVAPGTSQLYIENAPRNVGKCSGSFHMCMCICECVCVCVHTRIHICTRMCYVCRCIHTQTHAYTCMHTYIHTCMHACMHTLVRIQVHMCIGLFLSHARKYMSLSQEPVY